MPAYDIWHIYFEYDARTAEFLRFEGLGPVAQSIMCLATDASLTADQGVVSSIQARSHTFVEIDH